MLLFGSAPLSAISQIELIWGCRCNRVLIGSEEAFLLKNPFPKKPYLWLYFFKRAKRFTSNTQRLTIFMARILAFDYGTKRIGIAVTDPLQIIATGLDTVHPKDVIEYVKKYMLTEQVEAFVLGDPKQMDGSPSDSAQHVKGFATLLKKSFPDIPRHWVDERFTSKLAHQAIMQSGLKKMDRRDKDRVDTIAATIILQYFMESNRL